MIAEGKNAVTEVLKSNVTVEKVLVQKDNASHAVYELARECRARKIPVQQVDKAALDRLSVSGRHQGILAVCTEFTYSELDELLEKDERAEEEGLLLIVLDGVEDPHNVGAIIRVADCAGANGIILPKRRNCGVTDTAVKVSCGAAGHVKVAKVNNVNDAIRELKERGVTVFATDMDGDDVYKTNLTGDVAFVIGGEGHGIHDLTRKLCDGVVALPQRGKINSLNASVATGIVVYECVRQKGERK